MQKIPKISDTEWEVMQVLWAVSPIPFSEVIQRLSAEDPSWHPKTAQTLLNRLVKKKAVSFRKGTRGHLYFPLVGEADCADAESDSFLARVFQGSLTPMLAHFVRRRKLSDADAKALKRLLE